MSTSALPQAQLSGSGIFADDFVAEPYWWMAAPPLDPDATEMPDFSRGTDVAVVGGGITGIVAALHLARAGTQVTVLDSQRIGEGAARRSAGFLVRTCRRSVETLTKDGGREYALGVYGEYNEALTSLIDFIQAEEIRCHMQVCGRVTVANSKRHLDAVIEEYEQKRQALGYPYSVLNKDQARAELNSDAYCGGVYVPDLGAIHPGLYHDALVQKAIAAGVRFAPLTAVSRIESKGAKKIVHSSRGPLEAGQVIMATNGYTTRDFGWMARRVIPFRGYMIATEELPAELIEKVMPHRRTYSDAAMNVDFARPAPDTSRILLGGKTGSTADAATIAQELYAKFTRLFPDLRGVRLSRAWHGNCAATFDFLPHIGTRDGIHYALGYNFTGISLSTHFGRKLAARALGTGGHESIFDAASHRFPTTPLYTGSPWFVPWVMRYYDWQDRRLAKR
ncbi:FAD-binding oxidoreductase [Salipiger sp. P9]|uniref:NAD(P)/FAD-dependent oxidoreductase n=1 Tax=Salipiger pentaromativorans TaxID=2943193 RepID=UPI002158132D|nr:FAD-binding oxidoreductase [Salipiger pentaromativorans]MCR8548143.1 FAD-binding oxidoreductase [Salipiger pentaromativorans]